MVQSKNKDKSLESWIWCMCRSIRGAKDAPKYKDYTSGKEDYGFTVRIPDTGKNLLLNQRVTRIEVTDHRLHKDFAHHFLLSRKFLDYLYPTAKGMKQANLSTNAMKKLKVVLPGEAEQTEIATCFKSLDRKVVVAGQKRDQLQDLFRTLLHELMTAKTRVHELEITA